jgi:hypothetical protein
MDKFTLIEESGYEGKFVALPSFLNRVVIASGDDPKEVAEKARKAGHEHPVIFFVTESDISLVY